MVRVAIMQPYFIPYVGYFQLMNAVDKFVVYDNIQFTKRGWINRNRILINGKDSYITLPLRKDSDYLDVKERFLAESWPVEKLSMLSRIKAAYRKAPYFDIVYPLIEECILFETTNLFDFILNSLELIKRYLNISTPLFISSAMPIDHSLKAEQKVIAICKAMHADTYLNPIGGVDLYSKERFLSHGVRLQFLKTDEFSYAQFDNDFVPRLSILDVMMFNARETITGLLAQHSVG